ncbi:MAG: ABC transporter ATP-binding protein [Proteobacteria bacterium]|nr:ABC transporter ATP-binding protein [Pseudomonadota bacterium]
MADHLIQMKDVMFSWKPSRWWLSREQQQTWQIHIPEFCCHSGDRIFLYGPSGSGKSTFLSLLSGILLADSGQVTVDGHDLSRLTPQKRDLLRADLMGIVFQQFNLLGYLSVIDNVRLGVYFSMVRKQRIMAHSDHTAESLLNALGITDIHKMARALSVGQQQRVALARSLLGSPKIILADEPTSALDEELKDDFMKILLEQCDKQGASLIFVSHNHSLAQYFEKKIALKDLISSKDDTI